MGLSVISDIDDTIKDTGITKGHELVLKNTFFNAFKQVPCMAEFYAGFDDSVSFHYVTGAPWQLYAPLNEFLFDSSGGYPLGSMHMKNVRTNLTERSSFRDIWKLVGQGSKQVTFDQKVAQITQLIAHFPVRQFVLIGDSGERDPEVFKAIRDRFPSHLDRIIIRNVDNQSLPNARFDDMQLIPSNAGQQSDCFSYESLTDFH